MLAGLRHQPLADVDDFFQLGLERHAARFDLPRDFVEHARVGGEMRRAEFGQLFDQVFVVRTEDFDVEIVLRTGRHVVERA